MLLRYTGRRSGRRIELPVGRHTFDGNLAGFSNSRWRLNFRGGHDAELVVGGTTKPVRGELVEDLAAVTEAYARAIDEVGWKAAQRRLGIRINVHRAPTRSELERAIRSSGLSIVRFIER